MRISVRLWQTVLFVTVVLVAMLILSTTLFTSLERSIREVSRSELSKDAAELARSVLPYFPITTRSRLALRGQIVDFVDIFEDDVWLYDAKGNLIERWQTRSEPRELLDKAVKAGLTQDLPYAFVEYGRRNVAIASHAIYDEAGRRQGVVVVAGQGAEALSILNSARDQLLVTFWIALAISGFLGFIFSEVIRRQIQRMSDAALAIAGGDFGQRLPRTRLPDEIGELAESYNRMASQLGEAFEALRGQEREIAAVVEAMAEGVVAVDHRRVVRHANPVAASLLRVDPKRFTGRPVDEVVRGEELLGPIDDALSGRHVSETATYGQRTLLLHGTPVISAQGPAGAVLLIRDVTEQKRWENAQRQFIANASHEMRTPIAALKGFLELLDGGAKDKPEVRDEFLRTMQSEVERLQRLVGDLFTLAQLDSGRIRLELKAESLEEMVGDVVAVMGPLADEPAVCLETSLPANDQAVLCDRDRTVQVLMGFVDNAFKYCRPGDSVTVWAEPRGAQIAVGVRDTGPGIPPAALGKIFDRFYRAADDSEAGWRGAGLGLAIAKEIVEAHGSVIEVRSELGHGADFWFSLKPAD